jgi:hypothetical protein
MACISSLFVAAKTDCEGLGRDFGGCISWTCHELHYQENQSNVSYCKANFPLIPYLCSICLKLTLVSVTASLPNLFTRWILYESDFQVIGYPSKLTGLYCNQSIIFRSDSNGEDLEGYAGAGLYDRLVMKLVLKVHYNNELKLFHIL